MKYKKQATRWTVALSLLALSGVAHAALVTSVTDNAGYVAQNNANSFGGNDFLGVRGDLNSAVAQYSLVEFSLAGASDQITNATLRLKSFSTAQPAAWGVDGSLPIQIMVMSSNNASYAENSANWLTQDGSSSWANSDGSAATSLFTARDLAVTSTLTTYGGTWANDTQYDIALSSGTVGVLEGLRAAGETSALIYIQVKNGSVGSEANNGLRFWSDEGDSGNSAPELVMQTIPEPATLGLIAVCGGGLLVIRRRFMM